MPASKPPCPYCDLMGKTLAHGQGFADGEHRVESCLVCGGHQKTLDEAQEWDPEWRIKNTKTDPVVARYPKDAIPIATVDDATRRALLGIDPPTRDLHLIPLGRRRIPLGSDITQPEVEMAREEESLAGDFRGGNRDPLADHPIPAITAPFGKYWDQPDRSQIQVTEDSATMTQATRDRLCNYNHTLPTAAYECKMWARMWASQDAGGDWLHWFAPSTDPSKCRICTRAIVIVPA